MAIHGYGEDGETKSIYMGILSSQFSFNAELLYSQMKKQALEGCLEADTRYMHCNSIMPKFTPITTQYDDAACGQYENVTYIDIAKYDSMMWIRLRYIDPTLGQPNKYTKVAFDTVFGL